MKNIAAFAYEVVNCPQGLLALSFKLSKNETLNVTDSDRILHSEKIDIDSGERLLVDEYDLNRLEELIKMSSEYSSMAETIFGGKALYLSQPQIEQYYRFYLMVIKKLFLNPIGYIKITPKLVLINGCMLVNAETSVVYDSRWNGNRIFFEMRGVLSAVDSQT